MKRILSVLCCVIVCMATPAWAIVTSPGGTISDGTTVEPASGELIFKIGDVEFQDDGTGNLQFRESGGAWGDVGTSEGEVNPDQATAGELAALTEAGLRSYSPADLLTAITTQIVVFDADADGLIDPAAGGTGIDSSGETGFALVTAGTWSFKALETTDIPDLSGTYQAVDDYLADIAALTSAKGDVLYFDGTDWKGLAHGVDGQVFMTKGADANPVWGDVPGTGDITAVGDAAEGAAFTADGDGNVLYFEGTTANDFEIALTGANPAADVILTLPAVTDTLVGKATTDTLTNKTLTSPTITGASATATVSLTAANDLDIGAYEMRALTFESDIATGTAPIVVASTTVVTNLNADLLDGQSGTYYQTQDAYLDDIAALTSTQGDILYFNGTDWVALGVGSAGQILETQGAAKNPRWVNPAAGSVTSVGDCAGGACLDGSSDGGTYVRLYDGDSHYTQIAAGNSTGNLTFTLPTAAPGANDALVVMSTAGAMSTLAATTYQAADAYLADIAALTSTQGDVLYFNGTDWVALGVGTAGQFLETQGAAANPRWGDPSGSGDITYVGDVEAGAAFTPDGGGNVLYFEGTTSNSFEIALTGANPVADVILTLPAVTDTLVGKATTDTLTNKTLTSPTITGATATGTVSLTAANDLDIGAYEMRALTFESDIATGAGAPFTIASTTVVTNLNADLLDGQSGAYYQTADTDLATLAAPTAWRVFYSNGSSVMTQLALGADGTFLESNGASAAPAFRTMTSDDLTDVASIAMLDEAESITANWVNTTNPWADNEVVDALTISGGTVNNTVIGGSTPAAGAFTTITASSTIAATGAITQGGTAVQNSHAYLADIAAISGPTAGDLMYFNGTDWVALEPGTNGYFLKSQGNGNALIWDTAAFSAGVAEAYSDAGWNSDLTPPQKNDIRDYLITLDTDADGDVDSIQITASTDTTAFPMLAGSSSSGAGGALVDADLAYDATTNTLTVGTLNAGNITTTTADGARYIAAPNTIAITAAATTKGQLAFTTYNDVDKWYMSDGTDWDKYLLTSEDALNASTFTVAASTDTVLYPVMADGSTGAQAAELDTDLAYNATTNTLTVPNLSVASITSTAEDGTRYMQAVNSVAISAAATPAGRIAYTTNGDDRLYVSDGTDWNDYLISKELIDASSEIAGIVGDETGTGVLVFATSPTLVTPTLGAATGTSLALGADPADEGAIRLSNNTFIFSEVATPGTDVSVIGVTGSDAIQIGDAIASSVIITPDVTLTGDITVGGTDINLGVNGVLLDTSGNGDLRILGQGPGYDESLIFNFDDTENGVVVSTGSGVISIDFSAIALTTSGAITGGAITGTSAEINGTITLANDETIANSTDTQILFAANGGENLAIDLDTATDNQIEITSPGGATDLSIGSLNFDTTGTIQGRSVFNSYDTAQTLTAATHNASVVQMTAPAEVTMWDCTANNIGDWVILWSRDAEAIEVNPYNTDGGDQFFLFDGTGCGANDTLDTAATAGTKTTLVCTAANVWSVFNQTAAATDGGAQD